MFIVYAILYESKRIVRRIKYNHTIFRRKAYNSTPIKTFGMTEFTRTMDIKINGLRLEREIMKSILNERDRNSWGQSWRK